MNKTKLTFWQNIQGYVYSLLLFVPIVYIYSFILIFTVDGDLASLGPIIFLLYISEGFFVNKSFAVLMFLFNFIMFSLLLVANCMFFGKKSGKYNFYKTCFLFRNTIIPFLLLAFFGEKSTGGLFEYDLIPLNTQWDSVFEWVMILLYLGLFTAVCIFAHKYGKSYKKCMLAKKSGEDIPPEFLKPEITDPTDLSKYY
jgi:hypothetical protein